MLPQLGRKVGQEKSQLVVLIQHHKRSSVRRAMCAGRFAGCEGANTVDLGQKDARRDESVDRLCSTRLRSAGSRQGSRVT